MNPKQDKHIKDTAPIFIVVKSLDYTPKGDRKTLKGRWKGNRHVTLRGETHVLIGSNVAHFNWWERKSLVDLELYVHQK